MRAGILGIPLLLLVLGSACESSVTVLVQYGCDTEDIVIEKWNGTTATEIARFAPGSAPTCFMVAASMVPQLQSRCVSSPLGVPVQIGVFSPAQECN